MNQSDILSIIGIVISVLFGLWGIYETFRSKQYPASLTFVREQSVAILEDFAQKIPNLSVLYKDTPVNRSVVLISGYVVNNGTLDISNGITKESLTCILPEDCSWLEFNVTTTAPALNVSSKLSNQRDVVLDFGLFRRGESFSFQALALMGELQAKKKATDFAERLSWHHRIANMSAVKTILLPPQSQRSKSTIWIGYILTVLMVVMYMLLGVSQLTGYGPLGRQASIIHTAVTGNEKATVKLIANLNGTTTVKDLQSGKTDEVDLETYAKNVTFTPSWTDKRDSSWILMFSGAFMFFAGCAGLFIGFNKPYRRYKVSKLIATSTGKYN